MTLKAARHVRVTTGKAETDRQLDAMQHAQREAFEPLLRVAIIDGVLLEDLALTSSFQDFPSKLGRKWRGYIVTKRDATNHVIHEPSADDTKLIRLRSSASITASVWVF